jgi:hypothetical protein
MAAGRFRTSGRVAAGPRTDITKKAAAAHCESEPISLCPLQNPSYSRKKIKCERQVKSHSHRPRQLTDYGGGLVES